MKKCPGLLAVAAIGALSLSAQAVHAQSYPSRPVRLIVNAAPGGGSDIIARRLSSAIGQNLGQNVVVDNRPGAGGLIGASTVAAAVPDGYTLTLISNSHTSTAPLHRKLPYHPVDSFSPVVLFALSPQVLLARASAPYRTAKELIAYSKANPGKLNMGSSGTGTIPHLSAELLRMMSGLTFTHVPFKGGGPAMTALVAGQLDLLIVVTQTALPQVAAGRVRPIGVLSEKRLASFPDVPTIAEAGVPGYEASNWAGVLAPARTPAAVVQILHDAILKTTRTKEIRDWMAESGLEPVETGPAAFRKVLQSEIAKWTKVVSNAGIEIN